MPTQSKGSVERFEYREKALRLLRRFETLHLSFSYAGWLMRVLGSIVQITALPMSYVGHDQLLGCSIAP
jgi:hypothetical protein